MQAALQCHELRNRGRSLKRARNTDARMLPQDCRSYAGLQTCAICTADLRCTSSVPLPALDWRVPSLQTALSGAGIMTSPYRTRMSWALEL
jgi:hypothetical protein